MKSNYLLPYKWKKAGWMVLIPSVLLGVLFMVFQYEAAWLDMQTFSIFHEPIMGKGSLFTLVDNNIADEILGVLIILSALVVAFSREEQEDEYISNLRLESLVWATYVNYAILLFAILFITEMSFFWVMVFNMFTILIVFIIRFNWMKRKSLALAYEE